MGYKIIWLQVSHSEDNKVVESAEFRTAIEADAAAGHLESQGHRVICIVDEYFRICHNETPLQKWNDLQRKP